MFSFYRKEQIPKQLKKILDPLKKDYVKAIILFDEKGVELYSYSDDSFSSQKDLQGFLNLFFLSERIINHVLDSHKLALLGEFLSYSVSSIIVKFGTYRICLVNNKKFYILYVIDEYAKSINITTVERILMDKLEEIKSKNLIEDY